MKKAENIVKIAILAAIALFLVFVMVAFTNNKINLGGMDMGLFYSENDLIEISNETFSTEGIKNINISAESTSANVNVFYSNETDLRAVLKSTNTETVFPLESSSIGGNITIKVKEEKLFGIITVNRHTVLDIYIPQVYANSLKVNTSSGSIKCEESLKLGDIVFSSASGSIKSEDLNADGNVELSSASGSIKAANTMALLGYVKIKTASGSIKTQDITASDIEMNSVSGSITGQDNVASNNFMAKAVSGSINMDYINANTIKCSTSSGSIKTGYAEGVIEMSSVSGGVNLSDCIGSGSFTSSSGSVKVNFTAVKGNVRAKSTSGSVKIGIKGSLSAKCVFKSTSGSIHINKETNKISAKHFEATYGSGEYTFDVSTTSGSIRVDLE